MSALVLMLAAPGPVWGKNVIRVGPSGDMSGATDADNIEFALQRRRMGRAGRVDRWRQEDGRPLLYEPCRRSGRLQGTITGENRDSTIWTAVPNDPVAYLYDSDYIIVPGVPEAGIWATALHLEFPFDWTLQNMSIDCLQPGAGRGNTRRVLPERRSVGVGTATAL